MNSFFKKALSMILVGAMLFGLVSTATASRKDVIEGEADSVVKGRVYIDTNVNNTYDNGEEILDNKKLL